MKSIAAGLLCVFLSWLMVPVVLALEDHDWQFWNAEAVEYRTAGQWKARLEGQFYFGDDMSELYYRHADAGLSRNLTAWFNAGVNYRFIQQKTSGAWKEETRPHLNGTFLWGAGRFRLSNRNRLEYRVREDADDFWRYRNRLRADLPLAWRSMTIQPYVSNEVFIDSNEEKLNQNRASVGLTWKAVDHLKMEVYYLLLSAKQDGEWIGANVLGANLTLLF